MREFTLMLLAHILGDYFLQPAAIARLKAKNTLYVLIHAAIYALSMLSTLVLYRTEAYFTAIIISLSTHAAIDIIKQLILNGAKKRGRLSVAFDRTAYFTDQALHILIITALSFFAAPQAGGAYILPLLSGRVSALTGLDPFRLIAAVTFVLGVLKPANVFIQKLIVTEQPDPDEKTALKRGALVGCLERLVAALLLLVSQYVAISVIFAAKALRFKTEENAHLSEYYLVGTLASAAVCLGLYFSLKLLGTL